MIKIKAFNLALTLAAFAALLFLLPPDKEFSMNPATQTEMSNYRPQGVTTKALQRSFKDVISHSA